MPKKNYILPIMIVVASVLLTACIGLIPLESDEPVQTNYGPQYSLQQHHTQTIDVLWKTIKANYIYYETADVDWQSLESKYQGEINQGLTAEEFDELLTGLEADLPANSFVYQSRLERIEFDTTDNSTYEGIGAFVGFEEEPEPHIVLLSIISNSPAENAGLKAHDNILAIDGEPILVEEGLQAVQRIRGASGSTVTLTVRSPGTEARNVNVQRGKLSGTGKLEAYQVTGTNYGYLLFPPVMYEGLLEDILGSMQTFTTNRKLEGLILDLRIAGSSGTWPLNELYTMFYNGEVGEFYNRTNKQLLSVNGQDLFSSQTVPLVILVGANTQGYPEILAAGLQMHERATVVGSLTKGIIETSTPFMLPNGARIYLESTSFVLPNGNQIGLTGIQPDVEIEANWGEVAPDQDPVLDAAVEFLGSTQ